MSLHPLPPISKIDRSTASPEVGAIRADILWTNHTTGDVGMTEFTPVVPQPAGFWVIEVRASR
jgi:hypothetical protein